MHTYIFFLLLFFKCIIFWLFLVKYNYSCNAQLIILMLLIIETDLFTKPTDKHQHLLSSSCHLHHTNKAIPFSLALRLRRICSTDVTFKLRINERKKYLLGRGYNNTFLEEQFLRAADISRTNALQTKPYLKIPTMLYSMSSHIIQHFHALLISYANIFTSYTPLTVAKATAFCCFQT